jgi:arginyl-tRNA synthetase
MMALARYPDAIESACEAFEPSYLTRCLLDVARAAASYLTAGNRDRSMRVLVEDAPRLRDARLALVDATRNVLKSGLHILGLRAPEAM